MNSGLNEAQRQKYKVYREIDPRISYSRQSSPYPNGTIYPSHLNWRNLVPMTLYAEFRNLSYFWFLFVIIIEVILNLQEFSIRYYCLPCFSVLVAFPIFQNALISLNSYRLSRKFNAKKILIWKNMEFETISAKNLKVGDLILVNKREEAPADLLLLDCEGKKKVIFDTSRNLGCRELMEKEPVDSFNISKELDHNEIFYSLNKIETINVTLPSPSFIDFKAKIRYKGDPKTYIAGLDNFVIGGSIVASSDWILGLVVYAGMESKIWLNCMSNKKENYPIMSVGINKIFISNLIVVAFLVIISTGVSSTQSNQMFDFNFQESIALFILLYSNLISISYFIGINILKAISAILLMIRYKFFVINPMNLEELGNIEYLIVDDEDLIKHTNLKICSILLKELTFFKNEGIKKYFSISGHENFTELTDKLTKNSNDHISFDSLKKYFSSEETFQDFIDYFACALFTSFDLITGLTHSAQENDKIKKLGKSLGITLKNISERLYFLSYKQTDKEFLHIANFNNKKFNFVLVSDIAQSKGIIYFKSYKKLRSTNVSSCCSESDDLTDKFKTHYFYMANLNRDEIEQFSYDYNLALNSNLNTNGKLLNLFKSYSKNFEFLGCINFDYKKHKSIRKTVTCLQNSGIKTWIISANNKKDAILAAHSSKIFKYNTTVKYLVGAADAVETLEIMNHILSEGNTKKKQYDSEIVAEQNLNQNLLNNFKDEGTKQFINDYTLKSRRSIQIIRRKKTLRSLIMKNSLSPKILPKIDSKFQIKSLNFSLVIDSQFLDIALSSEASRKFFCLLLHISDSICFYGVSPNHKRSLVRLVKKNFSDKPQIMAVGNGFSDSGMLKQADVSVMIKKEGEKYSHFKPNFILPKFSDLKNLLIFEGQFLSIRFLKLLQYSLFKETMILVLIFLYQIKSKWSSYPIISPGQLIIFELFTGLIPLLFIGLSEKDSTEVDCGEKDCKPKNGLNQSRRLNVMMKISRYVFYIISGAFQGFVIYIITSFAFSGVISSNGFTEDNEIRSTLAFMLLSLSLLIFTMATSGSFYLPRIISILISLLFIILLVFYFSNESDSRSISRIISNQSLLWVIGLTVPLFTAYQYFMFNYLELKIFNLFLKDRKQIYTYKIDSFYKDSNDWNHSEKDENLELNMKNLEFISQALEKKFQDQLAEDWKMPINVIIGLVCGCIIFYVTLIYSNVITYVRYHNYVGLPLGFAIAFAVISYTFPIKKYKLFFAFNIYLILIMIVFVTINKNYAASYFPCIQILFSVCMIFKWKYTLIKVFISYTASLYTIIYQSFFITEPDKIQTSLICFVLISAISILCVILSYFIHLNQREGFLSIQKSENQFKKSSQILSYLLPNFVKKRVNDGIRYIAEDKGVVSVIFCDICDFDKIVETYEDKEIISLLDDLFSRLDSICDDVGVTKIETVGKTYLACAGLKDFDSDLESDINEISHATRAIEFAFEILRECQKTFMNNGETLKMKIGIHSGPVIAGVVGYHKPQFSLVGDTVNTASRIATTLSFGNMIQISTKTYNLIDNMSGFQFKKNYPEVKGKGKMQTYLVEPYSIKNSSENEVNESTKSNSSIRDSAHFEKVSRLANYEENNSTVIMTHLHFSQTLREKIKQAFFMESEEEKKIQLELLEKHSKTNLWGLLLFLTINLLVIIVDSVNYSIKPDKASYSRLIVMVLQEFLGFAILFMMKRMSKNQILIYLRFSLYYSGTIAYLIINNSGDLNYSIDILFFYFHFMLSNFCTGLQFTRNILFSFIHIMTVIVKFGIF